MTALQPRPIGVQEGDTVSIPDWYIGMDGSDDAHGEVEEVNGAKVLVYVPDWPRFDEYPRWEAGKLWVGIEHVTLLERWDEDGNLVWRHDA